MEPKEYERNVIRDAIIMGLIGLIIFLALVIYGFKLILGNNGLL